MKNFKVFLTTVVLLAVAASCMTDEENTGKSHLMASPTVTARCGGMGEEVLRRMQGSLRRYS